MGRKREDDSKRPNWVCFVDRTGFYLGERETVGYLLTEPKSAMENGYCNCGDEDCNQCSEDDDEEPTWESTEASAFEGLLDGSDRYDTILMDAHDQQHLWSIFRKLAKEFKKNMGEAMIDSMVFAHMPCGKIIVFRSFDDIPKRSVLCTCGLEWVIRYRRYDKQ